MFSHSNERPYRCEFCGRGFNQMSNLVVHKSKSHAEQAGVEQQQPQQPVANQVNSFANKVDQADAEESATTARRTSSRIEKFCCKICGDRFRKKALLNSHEEDAHSLFRTAAAAPPPSKRRAKPGSNKVYTQDPLSTRVN